jgi:hypothetical protein
MKSEREREKKRERERERREAKKTGLQKVLNKGKIRQGDETN